MWTYKQKTGELTHDGKHVATGYAGRGPGKNNPDMQTVKETGPLPVGTYTIGPVYSNPTLGPVVMNLEPAPTNQMFGRSLFRIHGDSPEHKGQASEGCIVLDRATRLLIAKSPDRHLEVVA